ncbi:MAG: hypothetical protein P4L44_01990 [Oryzomonas sp.]|uniref:hypothetical protein n=1 Tax=Oryzomonas sp. TaxID=2855186 RepID=UPI00283F3624|nr:hypothetical protein [Oryzomonas sp.]MDR3578715.1 hypothetical protein [Oryzomonas sp.]
MEGARIVRASLKAPEKSGLLFLSGFRPMTNNAINTAPRRMWYASDEMTGHSFRAMARTTLDEVAVGSSKMLSLFSRPALKDQASAVKAGALLINNDI